MEMIGIPHRDGVTYSHQRDGRRLARQHNRVFALMKDGKWRTLAEISLITGDPEASISARLRDFSKPQFKSIYGAYAKERRYFRRGQWRYRLVTGQMELLG